MLMNAKDPTKLVEVLLSEIAEASEIWTWVQEIKSVWPDPYDAAEAMHTAINQQGEDVVDILLPLYGVTDASKIEAVAKDVDWLELLPLLMAIEWGP